MARQVGRHPRRARPRQILRAGHQHRPETAQPARLERLCLGPAQAKGQVDALGRQVDVAVVQAQVEGQARMQPAEPLQHPRHPDFPETDRGRDPDHPAKAAAAFGDLADQVVDLVQQRGRPGQQVLARRGQPHLAGGPLQQPHPQPPLQFGHIFRRQPVRSAQLFRRRGERPGLRGGHEGTHLVDQVHGAIRNEMWIVIP
jgi:hypothetical protein